MTLRDIFFEISLSKLKLAFTPVSGTGLNPFFLAASLSASKSCPALANNSFALGSWIQPLATVWSAPPFLLSARYWVPVLLDSTRSEERRAGDEGVSTGRSRWSPSH